MAGASYVSHIDDNVTARIFRKCSKGRYGIVDVLRKPLTTTVYGFGEINIDKHRQKACNFHLGKLHLGYMLFEDIFSFCLKYGTYMVLEEKKQKKYSFFPVFFKLHVHCK